MGVARRTRFAGQIRARRRDRHPSRADQRSGNRVLRHPHANRRKTACRHLRNHILRRHDHRQRPRPKSLHQPLHLRCDAIGQLVHIALLRYVHDHRIIRRPALRRVDLADRLRVQRVSAQSVDRFRREGDQAAFLDHLRRQPYIRFCCS